MRLWVITEAMQRAGRQPSSLPPKLVEKLELLVDLFDLLRGRVIQKDILAPQLSYLDSNGRILDVATLLKELYWVSREQPLVIRITEIEESVSSPKPIVGNRTSFSSIEPAEAVDGPDSLTIIPEKRLAFIQSYLDNSRIALLRSPPYTGKTSLGIRLCRYLCNLGYEALFLSLAGLSVEAAQSSQEFNQYWRERVELSWDDVSKTRHLTYVVVDDVQAIYAAAAPFFWGTLKKMRSSQCNANLRVLLIALYDMNIEMPSTPLDFENALGLDVLRIEYKEFQEVASRFVALRHKDHNTKFSIAFDVQQAIYNLSAGHVGMCRAALIGLSHCFEDGTAVNAMRQYLLGPGFRNFLYNTRILAWIQNWQPNNTQSNLLRDLMYTCDQESAVTLNVGAYPQSKVFFKCGLLVRIQDGLHFAAPFMRMVLADHLFTVSARPRILAHMSFDEFLLRTIKCMNPEVLRNSLGVGKHYDSALQKRQLQMEWYRSAISACPMGASMSADVGAVFGWGGFIDFYVNGDLCWGVKLLCEGDSMCKHVQRFDDDFYISISCKDFASLDFRRESKAVRQLKPGLGRWLVCYSDDSMEMAVKRHGRPDYVVRLQSDHL